MTNENVIDSIMGFDPSEVVTAFNKSEKTTFVNPDVYKTNPKNSKSEDGHYHSKIRVIYNPFNIRNSIVKQVLYSLYDENGFFQVKSPLSVGDKSCPIFTSWKKLWFSAGNDVDKNGRKCDLMKRNFCKEVFDKTETDWVEVQIIEDENQPELIGQFKFMKMPRAIMNRMLAKMSPTDVKKTPQPLMDFLFGPVLEMDVTPGPDDPEHPERKQREISYDLCDFDSDPTPFIKKDGTPFFSDEEIEMIEDYNNANNDIIKAKTEAKKQAAQETKDALKDSLKKLYAKAMEYLKENALNLEQGCAYQPWDEETTARVNAWIAKVLDMQNPKNSTPKIVNTEDAAAIIGSESEKVAAKSEPKPTPAPVMAVDDDLPF